MAYCVVLPAADAPRPAGETNCALPLSEEAAWLVRLPLLHWLSLAPLTLAALAIRSLRYR